MFLGPGLSIVRSTIRQAGFSSVLHALSSLVSDLTVGVGAPVKDLQAVITALTATSGALTVESQLAAAIAAFTTVGASLEAQHHLAAVIAAITATSGTLEAPAFDPKSVTGLQVWYKADANVYQTTGAGSPCTTSGQTVDHWNDQSGNGNTLTQNTKPLYYTNVQNGLPVIRFVTANSASLFTTTPDQTQPFTQFIVFKTTAEGTSGANDIILDSYGGGTYVTLQEDSTNGIVIYGNTANLNSTVHPTTNFVRCTAVYNGTSSLIRVGGTQVTSGPPVTSIGTSLRHGLYIGRLQNSSRYASFDIGELLIYSGTISGTDLTNIENYLKNRWNLAA